MEEKYITEQDLHHEAEVQQAHQEQQLEPQESYEQEEVQAQPAQSDAEKNLVRLREKAEKLQRERDEYLGALKHIEQQRLAYEQNQHRPQQPSQEDELDPEDYTSRGYVDRMVNQRVQKIEQQVYNQTVESRIKNQYTDFDHVVSAENIAQLRERHPALAASLAANPDLYQKAEGTYTLIKQLGIHRGSREDEAINNRMYQNSNKPRPASTTPLAQASSYDYQRMSADDMKREREEMNRIIRNG